MATSAIALARRHGLPAHGPSRVLHLVDDLPYVARSMLRESGRRDGVVRRPGMRVAAWAS
jgi:hypothetical protein